MQEVCAATGQITDVNGGAGISGVTVSYDTATGTTDSNGNYTVNTVTGSHVFSFSKTGYTNPVGGGTVNLTGSSSSGHNGTLQQLCTVSGTITSSKDGSAISGATVNFGGGVSATTASDGTYSISTTTGSHTLTITKSGFATDTETVSLTSGTNTINRTLTPATPVTRLSQLKAMADNTVVQITAAKIVTVSSGVFAGNAIYIEESDRTCGIKVVLRVWSSRYCR